MSRNGRIEPGVARRPRAANVRAVPTNRCTTRRRRLRLARRLSGPCRLAHANSIGRRRLVRHCRAVREHGGPRNARRSGPGTGGIIRPMDRPSALRPHPGRREHESNDDMQTARAEPIRYTYEDYLAFPDDGRRHELIDGEHFVTPAPVDDTRGCRCASHRARSVASRDPARRGVRRAARRDLCPTLTWSSRTCCSTSRATSAGKPTDLVRALRSLRAPPPPVGSHQATAHCHFQWHLVFLMP